MSAKSFLLFSGSSNEKLAREIAKILKQPLGKVLIEPFPDGEIGVQILENVRGKDVFVVQSAAHHPNHYLMELLILVDALKRASCRSIAAVMPYFPYARQDRKEKGRVPITAKLVADLLEKAGVSRLLTMDLHTEQIQGFFNIPVDNLSARPLFVEALRKIDLKNAVVVAPDVGRNRIGRSLAEDLKLEFALVDKQRIDAKSVKFCALIGEVKGKTAILVDDIYATGATLKAAAKVCREEGAKEVIAVVTHGLFVGKQDGLDHLWVANTVSQDGKKARIVSVAPLFAKAIDCIASNRSISSLF